MHLRHLFSSCATATKAIVIISCIALTVVRFFLPRFPSPNPLRAKALTPRSTLGLSASHSSFPIQPRQHQCRHQYMHLSPSPPTNITCPITAFTLARSIFLQCFTYADCSLITPQVSNGSDPFFPYFLPASRDVEQQTTLDTRNTTAIHAIDSLLFFPINHTVRVHPPFPSCSLHSKSTQIMFSSLQVKNVMLVLACRA